MVLAWQIGDNLPKFPSTKYSHYTVWDVYTLFSYCTSLMFKIAFLKIPANTNYCYFLLRQLHTHTCKADCISITNEIYLLYMVSWTICNRGTRDAQVCFLHSLPWPCKH